MLQCVAVCCSLLQCVAVFCSVFCLWLAASAGLSHGGAGVSQSDIVGCSLLPSVAVCCSLLQSVAVCIALLLWDRYIAICCSVV